MNTTYPLTLLYDAACPVCALEMDHLRSRNAAGKLVFIDIAAPGFDAARFGVSQAALDAEIHARCADGRMLRGMQVLRLAYAAVGLGWVLRPTGVALSRPGFDWAYRHFARHRRAISRIAAPLIDALRGHRARRLSRRMASCRAGTCAAHGEPGASNASRTVKETS